ncbi:hypothetical protein POTOM_055047 [Populus tomentosa]|uniref:Uncharacterized protein n=1 Tax=Populus tomentosa TaxID=118781 RepID=A0A8X7Y4F2_POPTO|nr:hypothetical protein POTOM_055047 [Populus tomentosa]
MQFSPAQDCIRRTVGRTILLAFQLRLWINGDAMVVKNAMAARDIAIFSNTLDTSGNLLLINCETRREQKGKVSVVVEVVIVALFPCNISVLMAVKCLWQEKEVVYVTVVMLEVVVPSFRGHVIKMQRLVFWVLRSLGNGLHGKGKKRTCSSSVRVRAMAQSILILKVILILEY